MQSRTILSRRPAILAFALVALTSAMACGGSAGEGSADAESAPATVPDEGLDAGSCAPLDAELVEAEPAEAEVPFRFLKPEGWDVAAVETQGVITVDLSRNTGDRSYPDFELRLQTSQDPIPEWQNYVGLWEQSNRDIDERTVDGQTLYMSDATVGIPMTEAVLTSDDGGYHLRLSLGRVPDGCEEQAMEVIRRIVGGIQPE